ncbi:hypothetical protein LDC_1236 [sediment metagenome]|uniref:Uncharacterized protein n=1 Tax=sediment metagenome TaxID=749907 RepID=D9PI80_9ZZZZ
MKPERIVACKLVEKCKEDKGHRPVSSARQLVRLRHRVNGLVFQVTIKGIFAKDFVNTCYALHGIGVSGDNHNIVESESVKQSVEIQCESEYPCKQVKWESIVFKQFTHRKLILPLNAQFNKKGSWN